MNNPDSTYVTDPISGETIVKRDTKKRPDYSRTTIDYMKRYSLVRRDLRGDMRGPAAKRNP